MNKLIINVSQLKMATEKESVAGDIFVVQNELNLPKLGRIFGLLELFALPAEFSERFLEIVSDLKMEYYLPPAEVDCELGIEKRFEECLSRANRRINKLIKESLIEVELANISAIIGLVFRNKIFISRIGENQAFLFHQKKQHDFAIVDIFSQAAEKKQKIDPEKMFSNIISGAITPKDHIILCNDAILEYLSQTQLLEIVSENSALVATREIERILETQKEANNFYAIIIEPQLLTDETAISENKIRPREQVVHPEKSIDNLLKTQISTEQYLTPSLLPNWKKLLILIGNGLKVAAKISLKYLVIITKNLGVWTKTAIAKIKEKFPAFAKSLGQAGTELATEPKSFAKKFTQKSWAIAQKTVEKTTDLENYRKLMPSTRQNAGWGEKISYWLNIQIARFFALNRWQQIMAILAVVAIFFFSQSIVWQGRASSDGQQNGTAQIAKQIEEYLNTAEAQNIFNDEAGAKNSLSQAQELLKTIPDKRSNRDIREQLQKKINDITQALQKISYLENPKVIANLGEQNQSAQAIGLAKAGGQLFSFDNQSQTLFVVALAKQQTNPVKLNISDVKKITALDDKNLLLLAKDNEFFGYQVGASTTNSMLKAGTAIKDFETYGGKLYTLQPDKSQVFKHLPSAGKFNSGSAWLKDKNDASNVSAIALDGGLFTIDNVGNIAYFNAGQKQGNKFSTLDPKISDPVQIFSQMDSTHVYILDPKNQRVVVYDKSGNLKTQYTSKEFGDLKAMAVVEKEKKIYVLSGNQIYQIDIGF